jgi:hypothetical protein
MKTKPRTKEEAYAELVQLASEWADSGATLTAPDDLIEELHDAIVADPAPLSDVPDEEMDETVALYILFYAAAKRCGDL